MDRYKIIRFYAKGSNRTVESGLTLEQAQEHCNSPESSSNTCTTRTGRNRTAKRGPWFDGKEKM